MRLVCASGTRGWGWVAMQRRFAPVRSRESDATFFPRHKMRRALAVVVKKKKNGARNGALGGNESLGADDSSNEGKWGGRGRED